MLLHLRIFLCKIQSLFAVDLVLSGPQIRSQGIHALATSCELVPEDQHQVQRDTEVGRDEVLVVEVAPLRVVGEDVEVLGQGDDNAEEQGTVGAGNTERRGVGHALDGDLLGLASTHEVDVGDQDRDPGQQTEDGDQVDKVLEDGLGVAGDVHVGQQGEHRAGSQGVHGNTATVGPGEDLGGLSFTGETVDGTGCDVKVGVGSREDEQQDTGVDDVRENGDSRQLDGDDEGRCGSTAVGANGESKLLVVERNQGSDQEHREHVENEDSVEGQLDGAGDGGTGVLSLTDGHTDQLGTQVGESGGDHGGPEGEESASVAVFDVGVEGTGALPVTETFAVVVRTTAQHEDEGEQDDAEDNHDLKGRQPELELAEELDTEVVDADDQNEEYRNPYTGIDLFLGYPE